MEFSESCLTTSVQAKQCICVERALAGLPHVDGLCEVHHKNPEVIDSYMNHHNYNTDHFAVTDSMQQTERFVLDSAKATTDTGFAGMMRRQRGLSVMDVIAPPPRPPTPPEALRRAIVGEWKRDRHDSDRESEDGEEDGGHFAKLGAGFSTFSQLEEGSDDGGLGEDPDPFERPSRRKREKMLAKPVPTPPPA